MEKALSAYSYEHIERYFNDVKTNGLTEHGFPRLTSNMGILIANGRRCDLLPIFREMMEFCCKTIPTVKAANDFSVREIVCCIRELEASDAVEKCDIERWKGYFATIVPTECYTIFVNTVDDTAFWNNWALFTGVSEYFRRSIVSCDNLDFIDVQLEYNLRHFDENGMYMDNGSSDVHQPICYDIVPRGLYVLLLNEGYRGRLYDKIDAILKKSALLTLKMQSPSGEIPFGGRSNQMLNNEAWLSLIFEYEARRYKKEGNMALMKEFKAASDRALSALEVWLSKEPIRHVKNRFPTETKYGCEKYAYFDKYMITVASFLYAAYLVCDASIPVHSASDVSPCAWQTSYHFHKLFLKAGGYGLEFDLCADPHYDANGLGRVHRNGAPAAICFSCPCPAPNANYTVDIKDPFSFSACSVIKRDGKLIFGADETCKYELISTAEERDFASAALSCSFPDGTTLKESYKVSENGVNITVEGDEEIGYALPALCFDGEIRPYINCTKNTLTVSYEGYICRYTTDGRITDLGRVAANRNGHYRAFVASADKKLSVKIEIVKE